MKPLFISPEVPMRSPSDPADVKFVRRVGTITLHGDWMSEGGVERATLFAQEHAVDVAIKFELPVNKWEVKLAKDTTQKEIDELIIFMSYKVLWFQSVARTNIKYFQLECEYFRKNGDDPAAITALLQQFNDACLKHSPGSRTIWSLRNPRTLGFGCGDIERTDYGTPSLYNFKDLNDTYKELIDAHEMYGDLWPFVSFAWTKGEGDWAEPDLERVQAVGGMMQALDFVKGICMWKGALTPPPLWPEHFDAFMKGYHG